MSFEIFRNFSKHYSIAYHTSGSKQVLSLLDSKSAQYNQIVCYNCTAHASPIDLFLPSIHRGMLIAVTVGGCVLPVYHLLQRTVRKDNRSCDRGTKGAHYNSLLKTRSTTAKKMGITRLMGIDRVTIYRKIKRYNLTEDSPDDEVLHMTQKACNASVACNTFFFADSRPEHYPPRRKFPLYRHNME